MSTTTGGHERQNTHNSRDMCTQARNSKASKKWKLSETLFRLIDGKTWVTTPLTRRTSRHTHASAASHVLGCTHVTRADQLSVVCGSKKKDPNFVHWVSPARQKERCPNPDLCASVDPKTPTPIMCHKHVTNIHRDDHSIHVDIKVKDICNRSSRYVFPFLQCL